VKTLWVIPGICLIFVLHAGVVLSLYVFSAKNSLLILGIYFVCAFLSGVYMAVSTPQVQTLFVILRRIGMCLVFALLAGGMWVWTDILIYGKAHAQNSAGGGAAIGMIAMAIAAFAWPLSFVSLTLIDLAKRLGILYWSLSTKKELLILAGTLVIWTGATILLAWSHCLGV